MNNQSIEGLDIRAAATARQQTILTTEATAFIACLHREFDPTRVKLLTRRAERQERLNKGELPDFLPETREVREGEWSVSPVPVDLQDRRVEITGPTDRKMVINALNSGAKVFMADFEDANSPTWENLIEGQANLIDAIERRIQFVSPDGKLYRLKDQTATLVVRPRGWHLVEKHCLVDGQPISAGLFDFGLYFFHNAQRLLDKGGGPYFYLPKIEGHLEARLWNDVFDFAEAAMKIKRGTIKATVLLETILAAFEMEEILYELKEHSSGLNAGRWDFIFSIIKKFQRHSEFVLPDRNQVTMTLPFMRAYTELLVKTCHRRRAHAIGGMAAFIPSRRDPQVNKLALTKVREDKIREATEGFDGTWVAHPDLVPVAAQVFDDVLGEKPNQVDRLREDVETTSGDLLNFRVPTGQITEAGLRNNISVAIQYLASWLRGGGAVGIFNLMEDAATCEISRSQVWQWIKHRARLEEGPMVDRRFVRNVCREEMEKIRESTGNGVFSTGRFDEALSLFEQVALGEQFVEFLTVPAYDHLP